MNIGILQRLSDRFFAELPSIIIPISPLKNRLGTFFLMSTVFSRAMKLFSGMNDDRTFPPKTASSTAMQFVLFSKDALNSQEVIF